MTSIVTNHNPSWPARSKSETKSEITNIAQAVMQVEEKARHGEHKSSKAHRETAPKKKSWPAAIVAPETDR